MTFAGKHLDTVIGIDTHIVAVPTPVGAPIPTPMPNPYVGIVMDPLDYAPVVGATVYINGLPRAQAGTGSIQICPHLPLGGPLVPPPTGEGEVFMGSMSVALDGDAQSFLGMPVLTCQSIGMPAPLRPKGAPPKSLVLPTSSLLATPMGMPVLIGGPPTISLMGLANKAAFAGLGKLGKMVRKAQRGQGALGRSMRALTRRANAAAEKLAKKLKLGPKAMNRVSRAVCTVTGHPVDVATGKVFTDHIDLALPGALPFTFERVWYSSSTYRGPLGHGWHHSYDAALYVHDDVILHRASDGRMIAFPRVSAGEEHFLPSERLTLLRETLGYAIRTSDRVLLHFRDVGREDREYALTGITHPAGHHILLRHDDRGRTVEIEDSADRVMRFVHDDQGRIVEIHAPHPEHRGQHVLMVSYAYDERGNLSEVRDALGHSAIFEYRGHLLKKETDRNGLSFYFEYDAPDEHARCVHTWGDGAIYDHRLSYDTARGITTVTNSLGYKTQHEHRDGLVLRTIDAHGGVSTCEYDEDDRLLARIDQLGHVTRHDYDERGNLTCTTTPDGAQLQLSYDEQDRCVQLTDAIGGVWLFSYDELGRLVQRSNPLNQTVGYRYAGRFVQALIDPTGLPTHVAFDHAGNLTRIEQPDGAVYQFELDRLGRLTTRIDPSGNREQRTHDLLGRITSVIEADGNRRTLQYDAEGNVLRATDAQHDVQFTYQGMGRLRSRREAGTTVSFEYDTEEQLTAITNEHGQVYSFELGPTGEVKIEKGWDGIRRIYEHDIAGRVTGIKRPNGLSSEYVYNPVGRVLEVKHSDGTKESYAYRPDGALIKAQNPSCTLQFVRDALGRQTRELQGEHWISSEYDPRGYRVQMSSSLGADQRITRNAVGDVMGVRHARQNYDKDFEVHIARDIRGLEIERNLPGGVRSRWLRDRFGRPEQQQLLVGNILQRERAYRWEHSDRLRMLFDSQYGTVRYGHDPIGSLAVAQYDSGGGRELRMPDAVGNLFRTEDRSDREYGPAGQLLKSIDSKGQIYRYSYDAEGNLVSKIRNDQERWYYRWAVDGTLKTVVRPDGSEVSFTYDPLGRRISKTYRGQTTRWVWDGNVPLHEWVEGELQRASLAVHASVPNDSVALRREAELSAHVTRGPPERGTRQKPITWLFEPESFTPLAKLVGDDQLSITCDHLGTPLAMHNATGAEVWSAQQGTWGNLRTQTKGSPQDCPFRWPGQYEDAETGLFYNRFRYYDPEAGQYASQDPIGLRGSFSLHSYVSDTLIAIDPLGLSACTKSQSTAIKPYWPARRGFLNGQSERRHLMPGELIDRYGYEGGTFVSPKGIPYPQRALPPGTNSKPYNVYRVVKPIEVDSGYIEPAFGEPGMGIQHELPTSVARLIKHGFLEKVTP
jgi:RHS repeat-associated protein